MVRVPFSISGSTRAFVAAGWGIACLCALAAPLLTAQRCGTAGWIVYHLYSRICHQLPERSFELFGYPLAVCHRCFGIYAGMFFGCFGGLDAIHRSARVRRYWVLGAMFPLAFDALAPMAGLWTNSGWSRFATGLLFGIVASSLVVRGLAEFAHNAPWRRLALQSRQIKGDIS